MSYLVLLLLFLALIYFLSGGLYVFWQYWNFTKRKRGDDSVFLGADRFFVRSNGDFSGFLEVKGPEYDSETSKPLADVALVIDYSYSMHGKQLEAARWGARELVNHCQMDDNGIQIGLAVYDHQASILLELSADREAVHDAIARIPEKGGGTSITQGLKAGSSILNKSGRLDEQSCLQAIVLLTDGHDGDSNLPDIAEDLRNKGICLYCVGVGDADEELLTRIAGESCVFHTSRPEELVGIFELIGQRIAASRARHAMVRANLDRAAFAYLDTDSGQMVADTVSPTWSLPILPPEPEIIRFKLSPKRCLGLFPLARPVSEMTYQVLEPEEDILREQSATATDAPKVLVSPLPPVWLWGFLIHPLAWTFLRKRLCPKPVTSLPSPSASVVAEKHKFVRLDPPAARASQPWRPTVFIGLGRGGIETGLRFQAFCSDVADGHLPNEQFQFLYFDTCDHSLAPPRFGPVSLEEDEFVCIGDDLRGVHRELVENPELMPWYEPGFTEDLDGELFDTRRGASHNRQLGRLSLHHYMRSNPGALEQRLSELAQWLGRDHRKEGPSPLVLLATTATGGTGSAICEDLCHLLLVMLEEHGLEDVPVQLLVPEPELDFTVSDRVTERVLEANRTAFLLELERVKASIRYLPDLAGYPRAKTMKNRRFFELEHFVHPNLANGQTAFETAAAFALASASGQGTFVERLENRIIRPLRSGSTIAAPASVSVASAHTPVTLMRNYGEAVLILELLVRHFGVDCRDGIYDLVEVPVDKVNEDLDSLFGAREHSAFGALRSSVPLLFPFILPLSPHHNGGRDGAALVSSALDLCEVRDKHPFFESQSNLAVTRLAEWCLSILNQGQTIVLARARQGLERAATAIGEAMLAVRNVSTLGLPERDLLVFTEQRLRFFYSLLTTYRNHVNDLRRQLDSWVYALAEGFPHEWHLNPSPPPKYIGIARRFDRRTELVNEQLIDYASEGAELARLQESTRSRAQEWLENIGEDNLLALGRSIQWRTKVDDLSLIAAQTSERPFSRNIFDLVVGYGEENTGICRQPGLDQRQLESGLIDLAHRCRSWYPIDEAQTFELPDPVAIWEGPHHLKANLGTGDGDPVFKNIAAEVRLNIQGNPNFRESPMIRAIGESDACLRGHRRHVHLQDLRTALFQLILARNHRQLRDPSHPAVSFLSHNLHRLQAFVYLLCCGKLLRRPFPRTGGDAWAVLDDESERVHYLTPPVDQVDLFPAAVRFVLEGSCIATGETIPVATNWYPDSEMIAALTNPQPSEAQAHLKLFYPLVEAMIEMGGYVVPVNRLAGHLVTSI